MMKMVSTTAATVITMMTKTVSITAATVTTTMMKMANMSAAAISTITNNYACDLISGSIEWSLLRI